MAPARPTVCALDSGHEYAMEDELGAGGFGEAFSGRRLDRGRRPIGSPVCIKMTEHRLSWLREAYFGELLRGHDRAIRIEDTFLGMVRRGRKFDGPKYCVVSELAEHGSLADYLDTHPGPWKESMVTHEIVGLLRALDQLHGGRALHRDLTPFNILVTRGLRLKMGDFGIAMHVLGKERAPADYFNRGWAPPGLVRGDYKTWLASDDIFHLGQLMAVLLRGHARSPIASREVKALPCSNTLKGVILRAIGKREGRYRDALEMKAAIEHPGQLRTGGVSTLRGKTVVFTGLLWISRDEAKRRVRRLGGDASRSNQVTKATDVLIRGGPSPHWVVEDRGQKLLAASRLQEQGHRIRVINERQFRALLRSATAKRS